MLQLFFQSTQRREILPAALTFLYRTKHETVQTQIRWKTFSTCKLMVLPFYEKENQIKIKGSFIIDHKRESKTMEYGIAEGGCAR